MHHFFEAITNTKGDSLVGYFARVIDPATHAVVPIHADNAATPVDTVSGVANMAKTDADGNLSFYVAFGTYHLDIYGTDATTFVKRVPNVAMAGDITESAQAALEGAEAAAAASAASATSSAGSAATAAGSVTSAAAQATTAGTAAANAAASATNAANFAAAAANSSIAAGAYPNSAASNVPRGLTQASVGSITAGSGGANGTFALGWSGGNFSVNPTGMFTVSGGAVTGVTITGPGLYIGSSPTVPTPSFSASSGLTGAGVALTAQFLVANGAFYWAQSADGTRLQHYQHVGGVATVDSGTGPIPTSIAIAAALSGLSGERARDLVAAMLASTRDPSKIKLLVTKDGGKTFRSGSTTDIETLAPLIGPAGINLVQPGLTWSGAGGYSGQPLRPVESADGIQFHRETGFDLLSGVTSGMSGVCLDLVLRMPALTTTAAAPAGTYSSVAAMNADLANLYVGQMVKVTGGPLTNLTPDPPIEWIGWQNITSGNFQQGYYVKGNAAMVPMGSAPLFVLYDAAYGGASRFIYFFIDTFGRVHGYTYDGTINPEAWMACTDVVALAQARPVHLKFQFDEQHIRLWVNGVEVMATPQVTTFTPNRLAFNGGPHGAGPGTSAAAIGGLSWTLCAMAISQGCDFTEQRLISDAIARYCGTPIQPFNPVAYLIVQKGQSRGAGSTSTVGDLNRPDGISGWNGETVRANSRSASAAAITQELLPRAYACSNQNTPWDIGPVGFSINAFGNSGAGSGHTVSGAAVESIEFGLVNQLRLAKEFREHDIMLVGLNNGGWSLGLLDAKSNPPVYLYDLDTATQITATQAREMLNRMVSNAAKFFRKRGQELRLVAVYDEQAETLAPLPTGFSAATFGAAYEASARQWLPNELLKLVNGADGQAPLYIKKAADYSADGASNSYCVTPYYYTDQLRLLEASRDTTFRYMFLGESYAIGGRFIHWPLTTYRKLGERLGRKLREAWCEGKSGTSFHVASAVRSSGQIILTLNRPGVLVDSTPYPSVLQRHTTGGVDTYGFVLESNGGGRTITAVDLTNVGASTPTITISVSGGGAVAGDRINVTGTNARWCNIREATSYPGIYYDQDYSSLPGTASPVHALSGNLNETAEFLCPSTHVVA